MESFAWEPQLSAPVDQLLDRRYVNLQFLVTTVTNLKWVSTVAEEVRRLCETGGGIDQTAERLPEPHCEWGPLSETLSLGNP